MIKSGQIWKHVKTDGHYEIVSVGALLQCSTLPVFEKELGDHSWVVYRSVVDPSQTPGYYLRLESEFTDGRFEMVSEKRNDKVRKASGDYGGPGRLVATFYPQPGKVRFVVAFAIEGGFGEFYHILTKSQLEEMA